MAWLRRGGESPSGPRSGPDFSGVVTQAQTDELVARGVLEAFWLLPLELGGADVPENVVYVPRGLDDARQSFLRIVVDAFGSTFGYTAVPDYDGRSRVPTRVRITAASDDPSLPPAECDLAIWGKGLPD
jgi:hypothetical protein